MAAATRAHNQAAIDGFMAATKRIASANLQGRWEETHSPEEQIMKWPLEVGGEIVPNTVFAITENARRRDILFFRLHIFCPGAVARLDYTDETHANSLSGQQMGLPYLVEGPHYHSWALNRRFFKDFDRPPELHDAIVYPGNGQSFDAILRWFCGNTNIEPLPPEHRIELPRLERLF